MQASYKLMAFNFTAYFFVFVYGVTFHLLCHLNAVFRCLNGSPRGHFIWFVKISQLKNSVKISVISPNSQKLKINQWFTIFTISASEKVKFNVVFMKIYFLDVVTIFFQHCVFIQ